MEAWKRTDRGAQRGGRSQSTKPTRGWAGWGAWPSSVGLRGLWCHQRELSPWSSEAGPDGSQLRSDWEVRKEPASGEKHFGKLGCDLEGVGGAEEKIGG